MNEKTELRAWVENPFYPYDPRTELVYWLCRILEVEKLYATAKVENIGEPIVYYAPFTKIHNVHIYDIEKNTVQDFGSPIIKS